jgi:hypothetical protein
MHPHPVAYSCFVPWSPVKRTLYAASCNSAPIHQVNRIS